MWPQSLSTPLTSQPAPNQGYPSVIGRQVVVYSDSESEQWEEEEEEDDEEGIQPVRQRSRTPARPLHQPAVNPGFAFQQQSHAQGLGPGLRQPGLANPAGQYGAQALGPGFQMGPQPSFGSTLTQGPQGITFPPPPPADLRLQAPLSRTMHHALTGQFPPVAGQAPPQAPALQPSTFSPAGQAPPPTPAPRPSTFALAAQAAPRTPALRPSTFSPAAQAARNPSSMPTLDVNLLRRLGAATSPPAQQAPGARVYPAMNYTVRFDEGMLKRVKRLHDKMGQCLHDLYTYKAHCNQRCAVGQAGRPEEHGDESRLLWALHCMLDALYWPERPTRRPLDGLYAPFVPFESSSDPLTRQFGRVGPEFFVLHVFLREVLSTHTFPACPDADELVQKVFKYDRGIVKVLEPFRFPWDAHA